MRGATEIYKCARCGDPFRARTADRKRGWARFCSKSCKAIRQTQRNGIGHEGRPARQYLPNGGYVVGDRIYDRHGIEEGVVGLPDHGQWQ